MNPRSFDPSQWCGAIANPHFKKGMPTRQVAGDEVDSPVTDWMSWVRPTYNQIGPSCVGQGWANWLELMIRRYVPGNSLGKRQISGEAIWKRGREIFWNGDMSGGLYIPHGFYAAADMGIIPPESGLMAVASDWTSVGEALVRTPIVQAHHVHAGWEFPSSVNGCLDHQPSPTDADGYHCTLRAGRILQEGRRGYISQNSWGENWGWHGCFAMTVEEDDEGRMPGGLYTATLPPNWEKWDGWRRYLI